LKTNVWIKYLDILSTQYFQIKSICAVSEQTLEFEFIFLIWYFCPLSCYAQTNIQMTKKLKGRWIFQTCKQ